MHAGFIALAPDALSGTGGTPTNEDEARELIGKLDATTTLNNFLKSVDYVAARSESNGKTGCVGFCWGGAMANQLAVNDPDLDAAVAFYGRQPAAEDVKKIKARVQLHYGGLDERINAGIPGYEQALKDAGTRYELFVYEDAQHAFHNDTGARYDPAAACDAWSKTIAFFNQHLNGG